MRRAMFAAVALAVGIAGGSWPVEADDAGCPVATSSDVRALYSRYQSALARGDVEALTALYSPDAVLMGHGAGSVRLGHAEIAAYYSSYLSRKPAVSVIDRVVRSECMQLNDRGKEILALDGAAQPVLSGRALDASRFAARYSLTYARFGDQWLIVHHHQEALETASERDVQLASFGSRITTGSNPPVGAKPPEPPPPNMRLPSAPPALLLEGRPWQPREAPPIAIDEDLLGRLLVYAAATARGVRNFAEPNLAVVLPLDVPPLPIEPPALAQALASVAVALPAETIVLVPQSVAAPAMVEHMPPTHPLVEVEVRDKSAQHQPHLEGTGLLRQTAVPLPVAARPPSAPVEAEPTPRATSAPKRAPAVASFAKRAPPPAPPASKAAALPVPPASARPKSTKGKPSQLATTGQPLPRAPMAVEAGQLPKKTGKFLRWEDGAPIFDD